MISRASVSAGKAAPSIATWRTRGLSTLIAFSA